MTQQTASTRRGIRITATTLAATLVLTGTTLSISVASTDTSRGAASHQPQLIEQTFGGLNARQWDAVASKALSHGDLTSARAAAQWVVTFL
ncbi:MAG: hypothetical protein R2722_07950 [Tessaracoccus sp.]